MKEIQIRIFILFVVVLIHAGMAGFAQNEADQPNIVILFCDDLGYGDLSCYGHPTIKTPMLDKMAAEGLKFTNFYAASPKCTASRYSLLTGRLPVRSGFGAVLSPGAKTGIHPKEITMAEALKDAGYATAIFGKWHLGHLHEFLPLQHGFDQYLGLPYSNDMGRKEKPLPLIKGNETIELEPDQSKLTKLYTEHAIQFIKENSKKPFLLYLPYAMPHVPLFPGKEFSGKSLRGIYGDTVEEIDWSAGEIMKVLRELDLDKNTLVFFTSDNGPWLPKKENGGSAGLLRGGKGQTWEGGMRVPGIAWWPGTVPQGKLNMNICTTMDLYVSALKLAGQDIPEDRLIDGRDIRNILTGKKAEPRSEPFFYYPPRGIVQAVRKGKWKLHTRISGKEYAKDLEDELPLLFNLDVDPSEKYNLAEQYPEVVQQLLSELKRHKEEVATNSNFYDKEKE